MLKAFTNIKNVQNEWQKIELSNFLHIDFLRVYYQHHRKIKHLFIMDANMRLYAHVFKLTFDKTSNYLKNNSLSNILLSFISFDVLYLTNSFITNIPSFISDKLINLDQLLNVISLNYSIIVIPEFLFKKMRVENENYTKIEVEAEMVLEIRSEWQTIEDYMSDLRKKYKNKVRNIIKKTNNLKIRKLDVNDLENYALDFHLLFTQIVRSSQFKGPEFNTSTFVSFVSQGFMTVNGYFLNDRLVGFSSEMQNDKIMYSYYVGFDKDLNKSLPIYGRILVESIRTAIKVKKTRLILGRTANEYKSNFGAFPIRSFVYLKVKNKFFNMIFRPIYNSLRIKKWHQRRPFKVRVH